MFLLILFLIGKGGDATLCPIYVSVNDCTFLSVNIIKVFTKRKFGKFIMCTYRDFVFLAKGKHASFAKKQPCTWHQKMPMSAKLIIVIIIIKITYLKSPINFLSANLTKWSNTLKRFVGCCRRIA